MSHVLADDTPSEEAILVESLIGFTSDQDPLETTLRTDARVIARVTDGIYRQPGSALRELISNAYDADATRVTIRTDRPRFARMVIEDDGRGMSPSSLVHLLYHIGGSAKRTAAGADLGITSSTDPTKSPGGRPLIGKIGIGLFSVAQLTQAFQIITKVEGDDHRSVASVVLRQYSDQVLESGDEDAEYEAGKVIIWREPASDLAAHGTTVVLDAMRPQTRDTLRSVSMWEAVYGDTGEVSPQIGIRPPRYHIGTVRSDVEDGLLREGAGRFSLPWAASDDPVRAFGLLVDSVWDALNNGIPNPRLDQLFDYYLKMVWDLSLWVPLPYVDVHPFDINGSDDMDAFALDTTRRERHLTLDSTERIRDAADLGELVQAPAEFSVTVDDLELRRPIRLRGLPATSGAVTTPLVFVAQEHQPFDGVDFEMSGGPLTFQAYLLWAPKIAPTDHQGVMIRVHDASGTLFDSTFLRFPVAEQRRLTQITCEIFIIKGFDGALNIDRESFNFAHPHVVALTKWLHAALRRVIAVQKRIAADALEARRNAGAEKTEDAASSVVTRVWNERAEDDGTAPPPVVFTDLGEPPPRETSPAYLLPRREVVGDISGPRARPRREALESQLAKITQILAAFDLIDRLSAREQAELLTAIREILQAYDS